MSSTLNKKLPQSDAIAKEAIVAAGDQQEDTVPPVANDTDQESTLPPSSGASNRKSSGSSSAAKLHQEHTMPLSTAAFSNTPAAAVPALPAQYEILERVSAGGMGVVYKARHRFTGALLAIKVLHTDLSKDQEAIKRFQFEAQTATRLQHPNIINIHDFGINTDQIPYLVMDWIDGIALSRKIERDGPLNIEEAVSIVTQTADAVGYAHEHRVIHRDIKPENLMLTRDHEGHTAVRVLDFGIAKSMAGDGATQSQNLTQTGAIVGSPYYMSPEQGLGRVTDERSDVYSLGCVFYFALLGKPPFRGANCMETMIKHINEAPEPLHSEYKVFPKALQNIVMKTLKKEPEGRYQTMREMISDLSLFITTGQSQASSVCLPALKVDSDKAKRTTPLRAVAMFVIGFIVMYALIQIVTALLPSG